jgi:predicted component of type VI protein secretion system
MAVEKFAKVVNRLKNSNEARKATIPGQRLKIYYDPEIDGKVADVEYEFRLSQ